MGTLKNRELFVVGIVAIAVVGLILKLLDHRDADRRASYDSLLIETSSWKPLRIESAVWKINQLPVRRGVEFSISVRYSFEVSGQRYESTSVTPRFDTIKFRNNEMPLDLLSRLKEVDHVWYDPQSPESAAMFKDADTDLKAYRALLIQSKLNGTWP